MAHAMIRHLFPGSNTCAGFHGFYENLRSQAERCVILKGGPGVGKSTLMKDVGKHFEKLGEPVTYYHCSGDPGSLDGVMAHDSKFLIVDGTAPHVVDPTLPGAADGILNLGVCLDEKGLSAHREALEQVQTDISGCFSRAYRYLKAAETMRQDAAAVYEAAFSDQGRRSLENELVSLLPERPEGPVRHAFAQAITCQGVLQQMDSILTDGVYCLDVPWGFPVHSLLSPLFQAARNARLSADCYHDPLDGNKLSHLRVGEVVWITAVTGDHPIFAPELRQDVLRRETARLAFDRAVYDLALNQAVEALADAKSKHDQLERYYIDAMDYGRLSAIRQELMESLPR